MEYIIIIIFLVIIIVISFFVYNINIKKIKEAGKNQKLDEIVSKFPDNEEICKNMLNIIQNNNVKIKENQDENNKTSLYIALTNTISIANVKDTYTRIQTMAHECLHSVQSRRLLIFNFIYSNIYIIYFIISIILTILGVFKDYKLQVIILSILGFLYYVVRAYLETDAMIKAKYLANEYMLNYIKENPICTKEDVNEIVSEYSKINEIGIPTYNYILFFNSILKVLIYAFVVIIFK